MNHSEMRKIVLVTIVCTVVGILMCNLQILRKYSRKTEETSEADNDNVVDENLQEYSFHPSCNCSRQGPRLEELELPSNINSYLPDGTFVGELQLLIIN